MSGITIHIDRDKCKCTARCVEVCPQEVLDWDWTLNKPIVVNEEQCLVCYNCADACPFQAITIEETWPIAHTYTHMKRERESV